MKYMKLGSKPDAFQTEENNNRFVATELATDIVVTVGDVKFYLHKFPLLSKSLRMQRLVASANDESSSTVDVSDIPGGPVAFEICAKFCYGMVVTLNAYNVLAARCAAEYLEMHESIEKGNLIYKIEVFISSSIFRSWKDSIIVLQTSKSLQPWSETLKLITHGIDSIASKASIDPSEVEWSYTYNRKKLPSENGLDPLWNGVRTKPDVPKDWWVEDLCELEIELYKRVIVAIKTKGRMPSMVIAEALKAYAYRRLLGHLDNLSGSRSDIGKFCTILETIIWLLPTERGSVSCSFLLKLLKAASILDSGETCTKELVRRISRQLECASAADLLIPSTDVDGTTYNIGLVRSILQEFKAQQCGEALTESPDDDEIIEMEAAAPVSISSKIAVANLIDVYLAEVARDAKLPLSEFMELAEMASVPSRTVHDGLYRAIDMYLKEHPNLTKGEKKKICSLMDCKRLSPEACMHAVQNERLPLRIIVQVIFFEQLRTSASCNGGHELPVGVPSLLPRENGNSYRSSRSAVTSTTEDDWGGVPTSSDINSFRSMTLANKGGVSERSSGESSLDAVNTPVQNGDHEKGKNKRRSRASTVQMLLFQHK